jgi:uncharacterized OB-fold protein
MPRCPYCDAEYTFGEIYCKNCNEDLTPFDVTPSAVGTEPKEELSAFDDSRQQPEQSTASPVDASGQVVTPDAPSASHITIGPGATQQPQTPTIDDVPSPPAVNRSVGPVCPNCGITNDPDSKFCDSCGKPLASRCPSCHGANRPGAKFCQHCGQRLGEAMSPAGSAAISAASLSPHDDHSAAATHYVLILLSSDGHELGRFHLREGVNLIGAKSPGEGVFPDVDLSDFDDQQVISRRHAVVRVAGGKVTIADCGSTNGTRVDGTKIGTAEVGIDEKSRIMFANIHARLAQI